MPHAHSAFSSTLGYVIQPRLAVSANQSSRNFIFTGAFHVPVFSCCPAASRFEKQHEVNGGIGTLATFATDDSLYKSISRPRANNNHVFGRQETGRRADQRPIGQETKPRLKSRLDNEEWRGKQWRPRPSGRHSAALSTKWTRLIGI